MREERTRIQGPIIFGVDPQGKGAGVTLRFPVRTEDGKLHRLHLRYNQYYQAVLVAGVEDIQEMIGQWCIVEILDDGRARFARMDPS